MFLLLITGCQSPVPIPIWEGGDVAVEITYPNPDFSCFGDHVSAVYEDPVLGKDFKGRIEIGKEDRALYGEYLKAVWVSDKDGKLFEGRLNDDFESEFRCSLSVNTHEIYFQVYVGTQLVGERKIKIINQLHLTATGSKGRMVDLEWSKYAGSDFNSYLIYSNKAAAPLTEITDINTLCCELVEDVSLVKTFNYQVVVKTKDGINPDLASNISRTISGDFLQISGFVQKLIKDPVKSVFYALLNADDWTENYGAGGIAVIDYNTMEIKSIMMGDTRIHDMDISKDGNYMYVVHYREDKITRLNLNNLSTKIFYPDTGGWGHHRVIIGKNGKLYCHRRPPTSGGTPIYMYDSDTGNKLGVSGDYRHGYMAYNYDYDIIYKDDSNTTAPAIHALAGSSFSKLSSQPGEWMGITTFPIKVSEDCKYVFWNKYQFDRNLNVMRKLDRPVIACSPSNIYMSDVQNVYRFSDLSVEFKFPPLPTTADTFAALFVDDNTLIISPSAHSHTVGVPAEAFIIKMLVE